MKAKKFIEKFSLAENTLLASAPNEEGILKMIRKYLYMKDSDKLRLEPTGKDQFDVIRYEDDNLTHLTVVKKGSRYRLEATDKDYKPPKKAFASASGEVVKIHDSGVTIKANGKEYFADKDKFGTKFKIGDKVKFTYNDYGFVMSIE